MTESTQSLVQHLCARVRELSVQSKEQNRRRTFELRNCPAWPKDMPWYPRTLQLTPEDLELLHWLRQELSNMLGSKCIIRDSDLLYLALRELQLALGSPAREDELLRLRFYLAEKTNRA